ARVIRPERRRFLAGEMLHDRVRLPQDEVAVDQGWRPARGVERKIAGRTRLGQIDQLEFVRGADMGRDGANLPGVGRGRKSKEFHVTPPQLSGSSPPGNQDTGVIQPMPAPPGSVRIAMRPTPFTSKIGRISFAPAAIAFFTRASTSSTAM